MLLLTSSTGSYAQFITVLLLFVGVLGITAVTTRWIANYQKQQSVNDNIQVIETARIETNKYIQIIRVGGKYMVIAVCKDTVTMLGEIPEEQLNREKFSGEKPVQNFSFKEIFDKALNRKKGGAAQEGSKEDQLHDEK